MRRKQIETTEGVAKNTRGVQMSRQRDEYYTQKYNNYNYPRGRAWQSIPELPVRKSSDSQNLFRKLVNRFR